MKKIFYILFVLLVVSGAWVAWSAFTVYRAYTQPPSVQSTPVPSPTAEAQSRQTVHIGQALYTHDYIRVSTPSAVTVIPNFTEKKVVRALMNENSCTGAVNGGFYTKTDTPLGLFVTGGRKLGTQIESSLVNGFLWIDDSEYAVIASELPNLTPRLALQTGPLLMFNRQPLALNIHNDTGARRMTAAKTKDGSLLFLTVYDAESVRSEEHTSELQSQR